MLWTGEPAAIALLGEDSQTENQKNPKGASVAMEGEKEKKNKYLVLVFNIV